MKLTVPDLPMITSWLDELGIDVYQCGYCDALHFTALKEMDGVFDAKIDLIDNILCLSIAIEVKPSTVLSLQAEMSQINASSRFVKIYLDVPDEAYPKITFRHVLDCSVGINQEQFAQFVTQTQAEALSLINQLNKNNIILSRDENIDYDFEDLESVLLDTKRHTYH
ncbi:YbjN domain-containing protein [Orbaceae bacterium ESL0727]|nr:YbjN domain-containing protein [Orbaceae bacterium ESL0727]